jgi:hypothetical protein
MFANVMDIRDIISLTTDDITDEKVMALIKKAQIQISQEIYAYHEDERVRYINSEKDNTLDGVNTTFYTRFRPIADRNQDGIADKDDVSFYKFDSEGTRTEVTISSIDARLGKIILSKAPTTDYTLKVTYSSIPVNITSDDLRLACVFLTAALCYTKCEPTILKHLDTLDILRMPDPYNRFMEMYRNTMRRIKSEIARKVEDSEKVTFEKIRDEIPHRVYGNL